MLCILLFQSASVAWETPMLAGWACVVVTAFSMCEMVHLTFADVEILCVIIVLFGVFSLLLVLEFLTVSTRGHGHSNRGHFEPKWSFASIPSPVVLPLSPPQQ